MGDIKSTDDDDNFFDASDEFPFYDCPDTLEPPSIDSSSLPRSTISQSPSLDSKSINFPATGVLRRRRSLSLSERNRKLYRDLKGLERGSGKLDSDRVESTSDSVVESANLERNESSVGTTEEKREEDLASVRENVEGQSSLLVFLAELIVKAIGFQFNLVISSILFPFWVLYYSCLLAVNPCRVLRLGRRYLIRKVTRLWKLGFDAVSPFVSDWLKEHKWLLQFALRWGWGLFWSVYVGFMLVTLLIAAFVISGLMMRYYLVEEPFQLKQALNFDYTKSTPMAFVPITVCPAVEFEEKNEVGFGGGVRVIPPNHKLQATVTFVLPESDYNRNLGIFQVRVDFLSDSGKSLASLSHPCMLEFKSQPIRLLLTFFKIVPLVTGYVSETQTLNIKFRGYTEAVMPTACLKVTIEQRAEFHSGAGIPEVYDAFLRLESELPFLKRILWYWRKTIFIWLSMMLFVVELLFALLCCRPVVFPRARTRDNAPRRSSPQTSHQVQGS